MEYPIIEELMDKIGIEFNTIKVLNIKIQVTFREMTEMRFIFSRFN